MSNGTEVVKWAPGAIDQAASSNAIVRSTPNDDEIRVTWEWWRITQSEYHYKPCYVIDLGNLDEEAK